MRYLLNIILAAILLNCTGKGHSSLLADEYTQRQQLLTKKGTTPTMRQQQMQAELHYYLERHDNRDEGFDWVVDYAARGDSSVRHYLPLGRVSLLSLMKRPNGKRLMRDDKGRLIIGQLENSVLISGVRIDSTGVYAGMMNNWGEATGYGFYRTADGTYDEGQWAHDQREGFGLSIGPEHLRIGEWLRGQYRGEHMLFHTDRIYGIDISRYQHEKGRRRFPVSWDGNRFTHLGRRISTDRVLDRLDYPVQFVYIKSTEGVTIKNRYYEDDDAVIRRKGLHVGAYHFLSTRTSPEEQARHYLQNTRLRKGDLPPMLDIEPSEKQIEDMGGPLVLFDYIRKWIRIVEERCNTKPILYFNQNFAYNYLPMAPDIKKGYRYWVARYSEYKPDLHHDIWQLSGDGRVSGFATEVDLNVFNGFQQQWDEFLRSATIP
ncbi:MAG: glycosyl hydrolase family 25 [Prevotella sp.]|nr:glycosyl hydrolase family 25 [Prevotella sp.]